MRKRLRTTTALTTLVLLLLAQVAPAFDVCVCDPSRPRACCNDKAEPVAEPSCCSTMEHSEPSAASTGRLAQNDDTAIAPASCDRQSVSSEILATERTQTSQHHQSDTQQVAAAFATGGPPTPGMIPVLHGLRAPPPGASSRLFLLYASLLI